MRRARELAAAAVEKARSACGAVVPRSALPAVIAAGFALALVLSAVATGVVSCIAGQTGVM